MHLQFLQFQKSHTYLKIYTYIFLFYSRGKFGQVMRCTDRDGGQSFAAKFVQYRKRDDRENVEREVEIMNLLDHPKLLFLYDAFDNTVNEMCLVTE